MNIVIKTKRLDDVARWYQRCGLDIVREKHGERPIHYSVVLGSAVVLEFYPGSSPDMVSLGFTCNMYPEDFIPDLERLGGIIVSERIYSTIMLDPDGRKVLIEHRKYGEKKIHDFVYGRETRVIETSFVNEPALKHKPE